MSPAKNSIAGTVPEFTQMWISSDASSRNRRTSRLTSSAFTRRTPERSKREDEAEAVAYVVGRYCGLDTSESAFYASSTGVVDRATELLFPLSIRHEVHRGHYGYREMTTEPSHRP